MVSKAVDNSGFSESSETPDSAVDADKTNRNNKVINFLFLCLPAQSNRIPSHQHLGLLSHAPTCLQTPHEASTCHR